MYNHINFTNLASKNKQKSKTSLHFIFKFQNESRYSRRAFHNWESRVSAVGPQDILMRLQVKLYKWRVWDKCRKPTSRKRTHRRVTRSEWGQKWKTADTALEYKFFGGKTSVLLTLAPQLNLKIELVHFIIPT